MSRITQIRNGLGILAVLLACLVSCALLLSTGCAQQEGQSSQNSFVYGTTGYGVDMSDAGLNPHKDYSGWSCVRYGVGETLFKFNEQMQPEPWLATEFKYLDDKTCQITLRDGVKFSSGRALDAQAVKDCLEQLIAIHDRAPHDLNIESIDADKNILTIHTKEPNPSLINYLCDPYGAIVDVSAYDKADDQVAGTGPYIAKSVSDTEISLEPNPDYWGERAKVGNVIVRSFTDGDALTAALQTGEIQGTYGLPYASYALFNDTNKYATNSTNTSRVFFGQVNCNSEIMKDDAVRTALALGIDKEGFVNTLLNGHGAVATGPFPENFDFGKNKVKAESYDPEKAKKILEDAGWVDSDGDGIREKDGKKLVIRWLTYPGRMELPLLAESAQYSLKQIGIEVEVNSTSNHSEIRKDKGAWDVYVSAIVAAPTGDPQYFFTTSCLKDSAKNFGDYSNPELEKLAKQLSTEFDPQKRSELAIKMQRIILDDHAYFFASHLNMGIVTDSHVSGLNPHPSDYYEISSDLTVKE